MPPPPVYPPVSPEGDASAAPTLAEASRVWARIGLLSFGGPAGQIALMHRELIDARGWIAEDRFLGLLNFAMLLPGPEAQQLATAIGWQMHGVKGGLVAGTLFILPGFVAILALSLLYVTVGQVPLVEGLFLGLRAAVIAIVLTAIVRLGRRVLGQRALLAIAVAAFVAIGIVGLPFPLVLLAAAALGAFLGRGGGLAAPGHGGGGTPATLATGAAVRSTAGVSLVLALLWAGTVAALWLALGGGHVFTAIATFFSKLALVTFGGAYAVLAWVTQEAVGTHGWLSTPEMVDGLALAETTPGPLILVIQFVAFLAGARAETGLPPLLAGTLASLIAVWVTFLPCFLWIFAGAPHADRLLSSARLSGALAAITAAVVGVIAALALWFALNSLFAELRPVPGLAIPIPRWESLRWPAAAIAAAATFAALRWKPSTPLLLAGCAAAGLVAGLRP